MSRGLGYFRGLSKQKDGKKTPENVGNSDSTPYKPHMKLEGKNDMRIMKTREEDKKYL